MFFRTNRRSLKYAPKEFSKVNACARDLPWCYINTQFSRLHRSVTHANPEWYVLTVFSAAPSSFDLQTTVSCYNFKLDKDLFPHCHQNWLLRSWLDTRITVYPSTFQLPTKKYISLFFVALLLILSFHSLTLVPLQQWQSIWFVLSQLL